MIAPWYAGIMDKTLLFVSLYAAMFMYSVHIDWKKPRLIFFILTVSGLLGLIFIVELLIKNYINGNAVSFVFNNGLDIVIVVGSILSMSFLKKYSRTSLLFTGCAAYATFYLANNIYSIFVTFAIGPTRILSGITGAASTVILFAVFCIFYVLVYGACWFAFLKGKRGRMEYNVDGSVFVIFLLIFCVNIFFGSIESGTLYRILLFNRGMSCLLILAFLFNQSRYLNSREENSRLLYMIEQQKKQYAIAKESIELVNVRAHDIKHFVEIFRNSGTVPQSVISDLDNISKAYGNLFDTGNKALDITLSEKCMDFPSNDVKFSVIADGTAISFMSDVDIYILFGNIIENAKEAVLGIEDRDNRIIAMYLKRSDQFVSLHIENTFKVKPVFENGLPQTVKSDAVNHGFGTRSIQMIVEKYKGTMSMVCTDILFTIDIVFYVD